MKRHVKSAKLHTAVFIAGTNLTETLNEDTKGGLSLVYCYEHQFLEVHLHQKGADGHGVVPIANIASMCFGEHIAPKQAEIDAARNVLEDHLKASQIGGPIVNPLPPEDTGPKYDPTAPTVSAQVSTPQSHVHHGQGKGKSR